MLAFRHRDLADALLLESRVDEARSHYVRALEITEATHGRDHPITARQLDSYGRCLGIAGNLDESQALCREAMRTTEAAYGEGSVETAQPLVDVAQIEVREGHVDRAIGLL